MYPRTFISRLRQELAVAAPGALVLFGGSYSYGEANEDSDLDFYCVSPLWALRRCQRLISSVIQKYRGEKVSVILAPNFFFNRGWYFIDGWDAAGIRHIAPLNTKIVIRNSLKLSWWHYLGSLTASDARGSERSLVKARQQLAVAAELLGGRRPEPLFSRRALAATLASFESADFLALLENLTDRARPYFSFSLPNYLIYNAKFLRRGNPLFLFKNPDKLVLQKLISGLKANLNLPKLMAEMKPIIFPALIL